MDEPSLRSLESDEGDRLFKDRIFIVSNEG